MITAWVFLHVSRPGAALLFIGMPAVVLILGGATIWETWRKNEGFRKNVAAAIALLRRHPATEMLATATLLAGAVLLFVVMHLITD